ncbi:hypothetical protein ABDK00_008530 [Niabella insulamsoli]|uniref:hypothetical protein n=1 Tax=Niabella insulamsoli TaxID=3144874 RepID=UPI0031FC29B1
MHSRSNIKTLSEKCAAVIFGLSMLFMLGIPLFHQHHDEKHLSDGAAIAMAKIQSHCHSCDQMRHQHHADNEAPSFQLSSPSQRVPLHSSRYYMGCYKFTIQGFINKGPPMLLTL